MKNIDTRSFIVGAIIGLIALALFKYIYTFLEGGHGKPPGVNLPPMQE